MFGNPRTMALGTGDVMTRGALAGLEQRLQKHFEHRHPCPSISAAQQKLDGLFPS